MADRFVVEPLEGLNPLFPCLILEWPGFVAGLFGSFEGDWLAIFGAAATF